MAEAPQQSMDGAIVRPRCGSMRAACAASTEGAARSVHGWRPCIAHIYELPQALIQPRCRPRACSYALGINSGFRQNVTHLDVNKLLYAVGVFGAVYDRTTGEVSRLRWRAPA